MDKNCWIIPFFVSHKDTSILSNNLKTRNNNNNAATVEKSVIYKFGGGAGLKSTSSAQIK